nr:MAG TPA: repressor domain protein [Caudoviricetes sp.]
MANIQVFEYQNNKVRTVDVDGEAWFVLKDVCAVLGISNNRMAADRLDDDEKGVSLIDTLGGKQEMVIVNESGLYHVILRSDKPEAAPFRRWVTNDVLPAIRKTGSYNAPQLTRSQLLATALIAAHEELEEKDKQIETMKPKALFADAVSASSQSILVGEMAKLLSQNGIQMGQNRLFAWMRENGWATRQDNVNNRRVTILITVDGVTKSCSDWAKESGIPRGSIKIWHETKGNQYVQKRIKEAIRNGYTPKDYSYSHGTPVKDAENGCIYKSMPVICTV